GEITFSFTSQESFSDEVRARNSIAHIQSQGSYSPNRKEESISTNCPMSLHRNVLLVKRCTLFPIERSSRLCWN
ncbi:hypothetical protein PENTCL1PPCAC_9068, partial [Pristionchus entomophagus]